MSQWSLLVSNPPHREGDLSGAVPWLGLTPAEARARLNYPAPEVLAADTDRRHLDEVAATLRGAGVNVVLVDGARLGDIPPQSPVLSFSFADTRFVAGTGSAPATLDYTTPLTTVFCVPHEWAAPELPTARRTNELSDALSKRRSSVFVTRDGLVGLGGLGRRASMASMPDAPVGPSFVDLYVDQNGHLARLAVVQDMVDFAGLGELKLPRAADNVAMFMAECESRFKAARVDRRLTNLAPRPRPMVVITSSPDAPGELGYRTEPLGQVLESVSSSLKAINPFDLASRLAYLTLQ